MRFLFNFSNLVPVPNQVKKIEKAKKRQVEVLEQGSQDELAMKQNLQSQNLKLAGSYYRIPKNFFPKNYFVFRKSFCFPKIFFVFRETFFNLNRFSENKNDFRKKK